MELVNDQYLLELKDILDNSEFTEADLNEVYGEKLEYHLKNISFKTYSIMYNAYRGLSRERQRTVLNWIIQQDEDKQNAMRDAMIEYLRGAMITGMDLKDYQGNDKTYSDMLKYILRENGLWILAEIVYRDEDLV